MVEDLGELDESHLAMFARRLDNLTAEGLTEAMCAEMLDIEVIARFDDFELAVDHLCGEDIAAAVEEAILVGMPDIQGVIAVTDMPLEGGVNLNIAPLARLLLDKREARAVKELFPFERPQIRDAKPEEAATSNKERKTVHLVVVEPMY